MPCCAAKTTHLKTFRCRQQFKSDSSTILSYYPVYLNLTERHVLLIGAGTIALQKLSALLEAGAKIHVVAPTALPEIAALARDGKITWSKRSYRTSDLKNISLVIAATDNKRLQQQISKESRARQIWSNVVDVPPLCDFIAPAIVRRGNIQIAISTGGAAPALAKYLRKRLEQSVGPELEAFVTMAQELRPSILKLDKEKRMALWECIVSDGFFEEIKATGAQAARKRLESWIANA